MEQRFSDLHLINDQATSDPATFAAKEKEKALTAAAITSVASVLPPSVGQKIEFKVLIVEDNPPEPPPLDDFVFEDENPN